MNRRRRGAFALAIAVLVAIGASPLLAQDAGVGVTDVRVTEVTVSPDRATVGDRIELTIRIAHGEGVAITAPGFDADYGGLEVVEIAQPDVDGGRTTLRQTLTAFEPGARTIPRLEIEWGAPDGSRGAVATPPQTVQIVSVLQPGDDALRPLKPQLDLETDAPSPLMPFSIVALMALLTVFGYYLVRRAMTVGAAAPAIPAAIALTPADAARGDLDALASAGGEDLRAYYSAIAASVRRYLSEQFAFPAYAMTRTELQREMARAGIDRWPARVTANLLEQCDAVQFAGFRPPPERTEADLTAAYEIIEITSAAPAAGEADPGAPKASATD